MAPFIIFIATVLLMPFFTKNRPWMEKFLYFVFSICLTPILGIPVYWYIFRR